MSIIPELIIQQVLARGFKTFRDDDRYVKILFKNESQDQQDLIINFLQANVVSFHLTWPREEVKVPSAVILLRNENEEQAYLGDFKGEELAEEFSYDDVLGGASTEKVGYSNTTVLGATSVLSATTNTLTVATGLSLDPNEYVGTSGEYQVRIISGTGVNQVRTIVSNSASVIMISGVWDTSPDSTSTFVITRRNREIIGEPSSVLAAQSSSTVERLGSLYKQRYQIQLVGGSPEAVVILYAIFKGIFTLSRTFLESQGIINLQMGGTDLASKNEYVPSHAYMRNLNIEFSHEFDLFKIDDQVISDFNFAICDGNTGIELSSGTVNID